jgi:flagellar basal-body rod protein FlgB
MEKALDASWLRNEVIANNIANADTPGYKRKDVRFEEYLKNAVGSQGTLHNIDSNSIQPEIFTQQNNYRVRMDENNVDVDVEMTEMAKNHIRYNLLSTQVSKNFKRINMVLAAK